MSTYVDKHRSKKMIRLTAENHEFLSNLAARQGVTMSQLLSRAMVLLDVDDQLGIDDEKLLGFAELCQSQGVDPRRAFKEAMVDRLMVVYKSAGN